MNLILIAPPAAGKGTQSEFICNHYNLNHLSTGDLLREVASKDDPKSLEIKELMNKGMLISDEIILDLIENKIKENETITLTTPTLDEGDTYKFTFKED